MRIIKQISSNNILAISIGLVYLWFGALKFFPAQSPAEDLAMNTADAITMNLIPSSVSILIIAIWEVLIGVLLLLNVYRKPVVIAALIHVTFTLTPLFLFTDQTFSQAPFSFTLLGQYIFKNVIIIAALITLYRQSNADSSRINS